MGLLVNIPVWFLGSAETRYKTVSGDIDVILIDDETIDFPDYDIESDIIAEEMGFPVEKTLQNVFYKKYMEGLESYEAPSPSAQYGFMMVLDRHTERLFHAFETQGYDSYNHGDYTRDDFAEDLLSLLQEPLVQANTSKLRVLEQLISLGVVEREEEAYVLIHQLKTNYGDIQAIVEKLLDYLFNGRKKKYESEYKSSFNSSFIEALKKCLGTQIVSPTKNDDSLFLLKTLLSLGYKKDDFDLIVDDEYLSQDDVNYVIYSSQRSILLEDEEIAKWERSIESKIFCPISFDTEVQDLRNYDSELGTPEGAKPVLDHLGLVDPDFDEDDIPPPLHPTPDENGDFAVLYVGGYTGEEREFVQYGSYRDASDAKELSEYIFTEEGSLENWEITIMVRTSSEEQEKGIPEWIEDE